MSTERLPHDAAYKQFFSDPDMVVSLLRDLVAEDFVDEMDFATLERVPGSYVTDDLRERHDDIVWRVGWKNGKWCYVVLLLEFQSAPDHWMALRMLSYTALLLLDLVKSGQAREAEGLPPVFPVVIYNGGRAWQAPEDVAEQFAAMPPGLRAFRPACRYFLVDENRFDREELERGNRGPAAQLVRLERAADLDEVRALVKELVGQLADPKYARLRRMFTVWLRRVVFRRMGVDRRVEEYHDLREVNASVAVKMAPSKVVVNASGTMDDVSGELKEFLAYIRSGATAGELTRRIDSAVAAARSHEEWRTEYMTLLMRDEQMRNEGRAEGRAEERASMLGDIRGLVTDGLLTLQQAIDRFSLTEEEAAKLQR